MIINKNINLLIIQIFKINLFEVLTITMLFLLINCSDSSDVKISIPEIMCKSETFISDDYIFDNEGLNKPTIIREVPNTKELIVLDTGNTCFYVFSPEGKFIRKISRIGQGPGEMLKPLYFNIDEYGDIYVYEFGNRRLSIFSKEGKFYNSFRIQQKVSTMGFFSNLYVSSNREILMNLPGTGYYITVFNREGDIINQIGKIPENLIKLSKIFDTYLIGYPFVDEKSRYYIFIQSLLAVYIYDKNGNLINKKNLGEVLYRKDIINDFVTPEKQVNTGDIHLNLIIQDINYKYSQFYILSPINKFPITKNSKRYIYLLDEDLNLKKIFLLPSIEGDNNRNHINHKFEVLKDIDSFLMPIGFAGKILIFKPL